MVYQSKGDSFMNEYYPFHNLPLPYAYNALEPYIDELTMHLHHDRHLQTYIDNLNSALANHPEAQKLSLQQLIQYSNRLPNDIRTAVRNNAGGVYNHRLYFDSMTPDLQQPSGALADAVDKEYGGIDGFRQKFKAAAMSVFGSGYAWLCASPSGKLSIVTSPNQDTPLSRDCCPVLLADVWEHAYYLKHYNLRAAYLDAWFQVVDWNKAGERYTNCLSARQKSGR
jgi:Fe-Mn family superoxide dismutase